MGRLISLHDKNVIADFLMKDPVSNILAIGDLDAFFWPSTVWYGWQENDQLVDVALLYCGAGMPVLLCFCSKEDVYTPDFCAALKTVIPANVYTHLYPDVADYFEYEYRFVAHGRHYKMEFKYPEKAKGFHAENAVPLSLQDLDAVHAIFEAAYPGNFFDPRMLETGLYYGIWEQDRLISVAGIHVFSEEYDVAAIGNVTTHPDYRNRGLAKVVCARLIQALQERVSKISLNVKADNLPAIQAYQKLGFEKLREYDEFEFYRQLPGA